MFENFINSAFVYSPGHRCHPDARANGSPWCLRL
jgi:hypothetical protein